MSLCKIIGFSYLFAYSNFSVSPHDMAVVFFENANSIRYLHGTAVAGGRVGVHEDGVGGAVCEGLERRRVLAKTVFAFIEEGLEIELERWVHVRHKELGHVTAVQDSSVFLLV